MRGCRRENKREASLDRKELNKVITENTENKERERKQKSTNKTE
jgi:hypothetical protein